MSLDLTQFYDTFFEESFEALDSMEAALLKLDVGSPDQDSINLIFRVAHSIKGGSATFGFTEVASFTHTLETLLDELRGNRIAVTMALSDLLLKSVDVMRAMLRSVQSKQPIDAQNVADLQLGIEAAIAQKSSAAPPAAKPAPAAVATVPAVAAPAATAAPAPDTGGAGDAWRIEFRPYEGFFLRGNDPLRMLRALAELGQATVTVEAGKLPTLDALDPHSCYLAWKIGLTGTTDEAAIREVFDWATGDCDLIVECTNPPVALPPVIETVPVEPAPAAATTPRTEAATNMGGETSIRVSVEKLDELINTVGELVITQAMLSQLSADYNGPNAEQFRGGLAQLERNMRELQDSVMRVRMLPISVVFNRFPRMVRDLAQRLGKQVELKLTGEQTELDKTVLEKIGDPLVHLIRNSIDHGIEKEDVRTAAGKPAAGTIHLDASHRGGNIAVEIIDDGGGLNRDRILTKARERGLVDANAVLTDDQIYELIFLPGFSTAEQTTDISGRGVGMDVVRRNIKALGGSVEVRSEPGKGSRFIINLPLTLAIVDGQSVAVGDETYIVPLTSIIESLQLKPGNINRISGHTEVFSFRGEYLPVIRVHDVFGTEPRTRNLHEGLVVVVEGEGRRVGLFVDDLLGQQQVVIKSLEANYGHVDGISGATILGDGAVALILDIPGLLRMSALRSAA